MAPALTRDGALVNNDFHENQSIFELFKDLEVEDLDREQPV